MRLYEKYILLLPDNPKCGAMYKYGLSKATLSPRCWFTDKPVGVNALKKVISNMMKEAGISGRFTNHSLHATTATRMFQKGVNEQLIKCVTGHKSDSVRVYKKPSDTLLKSACSTVVNRHAARPGDKVRTVEYNKDYVAPPEFDIDAYEIRPEDKVSYKLDQTECESVKSHKRKCTMVDDEGNCTGLCTVLKKLDEKSNDKKVKKFKLCVEFKK